MSNKKREYVIAGVILLVACIVSAVILFFPQQGKDENETENKNVEYQVTFHKTGGEVLETRTALSDTPVEPPAIEQSSSYFKGWDRELYCVSEDMDVYPLIEDVSKVKNAVFADTVYAKNGDEFSVFICLGGNVSCSDFTIEGAYDSDLLKYCGEGEMLDGITVYNDKKTGKITIVKDDDISLKEPVNLVELRFCCREEGCYKTNLPLQTKEIDAEGNYTDSTAYDCAIHLYD